MNKKNDNWIDPVYINDGPPLPEEAYETLREYAEVLREINTRLVKEGLIKNVNGKMVHLVNPDQKTPPSNKHKIILDCNRPHTRYRFE